MRTREFSTRVQRAAGAAMGLALAAALSACGGGGGGEVAAAPSASQTFRPTIVATPRSAAAVTGTANLLSNGDFEAGMTGWVDWGNTQVIDGAGASGTGRALRVGTAAGGAGQDVSGISAGTRYRLTAQVKVSDASEVAYVGINIRDQWGNVIAQQAAPVSTTAYSLATVEVAAPANAATANVFVWKNAGAGSAYVDDFVFAPADAAASAGANLVAEPGFENALASWSNWGNASVAAGQGSSGAAALRVGTGAGGVGQDVAGVVAGTTYRLSGQARVSDPSDVAYLGVAFLDTWGVKLQEQAVPVSATSYATATLDIAAPANTARALVYVWKNAGSGFAYVDDVVLAPLGGSAAAAPPPAAAAAPSAPSAPAPAPAPTVAPIALSTWPTTLLQVGRSNDAYWVEDGVWAPWGLTRGGYGGIYGSTYEQYTGVSPDLGPNGEVAFRISWKWPQCCNEIKSFPSIVSGRKPGWYNSWTKPGGFDVLLPDGSYSQTFPSGATPGTFFPLQLPIASLKTSFNYTHMSTPDGRGHLAYDMFLQSTPDQVNGFGTNVTHEIMIPLDYWGGYGQYPNRNPAWYDHDVTIDGILFHIYAVKDASGAVAPSFMNGWKFIVFEPDQPIQPGTLDLAKFINYVATQRDALGQPWANGNEWLASVELGTEVQQGTGDVQVSNYRVWR